MNNTNIIKKFKIIGSTVGATTIIALSNSCAVKNQNNISNNNSYSTTISYNSFETPEFTDDTCIVLPEESLSSNTIYSTTTSTKETAIATPTPETSITLTTTTKTPIVVPETTTTQITTTATTKVQTTTPATTKVQTTTPATTKVQTTTTQTTTATTSIPQVPKTREEELIDYYKITSYDTDAFTINNINDYDTFLTVWDRFYAKTIVNTDGGNIIFYEYTVAYDVNTNEYSYSKITDSKLEKLIFLSLLNYDYINDEVIKKLLKPYTKEELKGFNSNMIFILSHDINNNTYYDYSKIIVNKDLSALFTKVQKAVFDKDYITLEKTVYDNLGKYNDMVDAILTKYGTYSPTFNSEQFSRVLAEQAIDTMGVYDRVHPKTLVLE